MGLDGIDTAELLAGYVDALRVFLFIDVFSSSIRTPFLGHIPDFG